MSRLSRSKFNANCVVNNKWRHNLIDGGGDKIPKCKFIKWMEVYKATQKREKAKEKVI